MKYSSAMKIYECHVLLGPSFETKKGHSHPPNHQEPQQQQQQQTTTATSIDTFRPECCLHYLIDISETSIVIL